MTEHILTEQQAQALANLSARYGVPFDPADFRPVFDLPAGWVGGWIGGWIGGEAQRLYVGCSPEGEVHS